MNSIDSEVSKGIAEGVIHGAVLQAGTAHEDFFAKAWGYADAESRTEMGIDTVIDLASVTKVLATTSALAICRDRGLVDLDAAFTCYLPDYSAAMPKPITVRELATHTSGFGQQCHYDDADGHDIRRNMLATPPSGAHGKFEYSCWNFQLLGMLLEEVTGCLLPEFCRTQIFEPLGMRDSSLGAPLPALPVTRLAQTYATDRPGQISDFIAFRLYRDGLTAGNAGAFSSAPDLATFCRCLLQDGEYGYGKRMFSPESLADMSTPYIQDSSVRRGMGWIVADELKPPGFSDRTIYHSGWSGQTVFLDLDQQFYAVVLTVRSEEYERARRGRFRLIGELGRLFRASEAGEREAKRELGELSANETDIPEPGDTSVPGNGSAGSEPHRDQPRAH